MSVGLQTSNGAATVVVPPSLLGMAGARAHSARRTKATRHALGRAWARFRPVSLSVAGLACFTAAAWVVALPLGLLVAGVGCLLLEWRLHG
jgi:hypothetical protein